MRPYAGAYGGGASAAPVHTRRCAGRTTSDTHKMAATLEEAVRRVGLRDGMTVSFHHSFREGDKLIGQVVTDCLVDYPSASPPASASSTWTWW